jgi:hypothetical protein
VIDRACFGARGWWEARESGGDEEESKSDGGDGGEREGVRSV